MSEWFSHSFHCYFNLTLFLIGSMCMYKLGFSLFISMKWLIKFNPKSQLSMFNYCHPLPPMQRKLPYDIPPHLVFSWPDIKRRATPLCPAILLFLNILTLALHIQLHRETSNQRGPSWLCQFSSFIRIIHILAELTLSRVWSFKTW